MNVSTRTSTTATLTNCQSTSINNSKFNLLGKPSLFMRWFFVLMMFVSVGVNAQSTANYTFATNATSSLALDKNGNTIDMTTGTTGLVTATSSDQGVSAITDIGFGFVFMGNGYSKFSASANGVIQLGTTVVGAGTYVASGGSVASPRLSAFGADLGTGTSGSVKSKVVGTAPNRCLVTEFNNMTLLWTSSYTNDGTFQARLYEDGTIEYVYGAMSITSTASASDNSVSIGFSVGTAANSFAYVTTSSNSNTTTGTFTDNPTYATGAITNLNSASNGLRRAYTWTPNINSQAGPSSLGFSAIGINSITLNWTAASPTTNVYGYAIYNSIDGGVTFNYAGAVSGSGTVTATISGLTAATNYQWNVYSLAEGTLSASSAFGVQGTNSCSISGTKAIGTGGDYATLTLAIADLQLNGVTGPVILELNSSYTSTGETFPLVLGAVPCASASNTITIRPGVAGKTITSTNTTATISIDGGNYYIIDGRVGGTGSTKNLIISNTSTGTALRFINEGSNNVVKYSALSSASASTTSGVIVFSTTTGANGNDNNTIDNCDIDGLAGATASPTTGISYNGIYASGSGTTGTNTNSGNTISNNNIFNVFYAGGSATNGILVSSGNTDWIITGNSIYQTATRTGTSGATHSGININNSSANNMLVSGNFIGGGAASAGGSAWTLTGTVAVRFRGISLTSVGTTTPSSVQGNTIANLAISTNTSATTVGGPWVGIYLGSGNANIGTVTGNTIGSLSSNGSISITAVTTSGGVANGIFAEGSSTYTISNNTIGGVTSLGSQAMGFSGITINAATSATVSNNIIGGTVASNINYSGTYTATTAEVLTGINVVAGTTVAINNNVVTNFNNGYLPAAANTAALLRGIIVSGGTTVSVTGNTVRALTTAANGTGTGTTASVIGISATSAATITSNKVYALSNTNATAASYVTGIQNSGSGTIEKNLIYSITSPSTIALVNGIHANGGTATYRNNMVRLGIDSLGTATTTATSYNGILETTGTNNIWHNTVYIGGTGVAVSPAINTYAYYFNTTSSTTHSVRDNIFVNERSSASAAGKHYAIRLGVATSNLANLNINNNNYQATGAFSGVLGFNNGADVTTLALWKTSTTQDAASLNNPSCLANPTAGTPDLHLTDCGGAGNTLDGSGFDLGVTDDYDGQLRTNLTPTDIGADAANVGATGVDVGITALVTPGTGPCYTNAETVSVTLKNFSVSSPSIDFSVNPVTVNVTATGGYSSSFNLTSGTLASNATMTVTMPSTIDMSANNTYVFTSTSVLTGDVNPVNNTNITNKVVNSLGGSYTVGSGGNFATITAAVAAYNTATCITGPITFNLTDPTYSGSETFPISINLNTQASSTNTLTIKPASANTATISGSQSAALIKLNACKFVTIDGSNNGSSSRNLTITNTGTGGSTAVQVVSAGTAAGALNNTIKNCNISTGVATSLGYGIAVGGSTPGTSGADNDNTTIQNNNITVAPVGIYAVGTASVTAGGDDNLVISGNTVDYNGTLASIGIQVGNALSSSVTQNTVTEETTTSQAPTAISVETGFVSSSVTKNVITKSLTTNTGGYGGRGITVGTGTAASSLTIANNMISGVNGSNWSGFTNSSSMGLVIGAINSSSTLTTTAGGINLYHNTVSMDGTMNTASTTAITTALYIGSGATALDIRDNIFSNTQVGTATGQKNYAIYSAAANTAFTNINYNNYSVSNTFNAPSAILGFLTSDRATLAALQTGFGGNVNSSTTTPVFTSPSDLHLIPASNGILDNTGTSVGVTTDIDGDTRSGSTPDMGADEFTAPAGVDVGITAIVTPNTSGCYTANEIVRATLKNYTNFTLDLSVNPVTVTVGGSFTLSGTYNAGTIPPQGTVTVILPGSGVDMTAYAAYTFNASATVVGDLNTANDALATVTINSVAPVVGVASSSPASYCLTTGTPTLSLASANGGSIQWQESGVSATGPWTNVGTNSLTYTPSVAISATAYYQAIVSCGANSVTSNVVTVAVNNPAVTAHADGTHCGAGTVTLGATPSAGATINWYTASTGGSPIATGTSYTTPVLSSSNIYYASANQGGSTEFGGKPVQTTNTSTIFTQSGIIFDATQSFTLNSTVIYPTGTGNVTIALYTYSGSTQTEVVSTAAIPVSGDGVTPVTVPLGFSITPGTNYYLMLKAYTGITALVRDGSGNTFPYASPSGAISVTAGTLTPPSTSASYYFFYNLNISTGCESARTAVTANITAAPAITPTGTATICAGQSTPLNVTSPNDPNYTYVWTPGPLTGASQSVSPASTTTYTITATDNTAGPNAGCGAVGTVTVTVNPVPVNVTATASASTVCSGATVNLTGTGANGTPLTGYTANTNSGVAFIDISSTGTAVGTVGDDSEHPLTLPFTFYFNAVPYTTALVGNNGAFVFGSASGDIDAGNVCIPAASFGTSGIPGIAAYWDDLLPTAADAIKTQLVGSKYIIQWTGEMNYDDNDLNGGTGTITFQIQLDQLTGKINLVYQDVLFGNSTYDAGLTATVGLNYTASTGLAYLCNAATLTANQSITYTPNVNTVNYAWTSTPPGFTSAVQNPTNVPVSSPSSTYTLTVSIPATGCSASATTSAVSISTLDASTSQTNVLCKGQSTGSFTATGTGGTPGYTYSLDNITFQGSGTFSGLAAGTYTVYVKDALPCVISKTVIITEPATVVSGSVVTSTDPTCNNGTNGSVTVAGSDGTPGYTYDLDGGAQTNGTGTFTGLASGAHSVIVKDANNCTFTVNFSLNNPTAIPVTASNNGPVCAGSNAQLNASPSGYVSYVWSGPGTITDATTADDVAIAVTPTNGDVFTVTVTDGNGCTNTATTTVSVTAIAPVSASIAVSPSNEICSETPVTFTATATNGGATPNYEFFINNVSVQNGTSNTYNSSTMQDGDVVYVVVTSSLPCISGSPATSSSITMSVQGSIIASVTLAPSANPVCAGTAVTYTATPTGGGTTPTYEFFVNTVSVQNTTSNTYTYTPVNGDEIYVVMTPDANFPCAIGTPSSDPVTMTVNPVPAAPTISANGPTTFCNGGTVTLSSSYTGAGNVWSPGAATTDNIVVTSTNTYTVTYTALGCASPASAPVTVTVNDNPVATITGSNTFCSNSSTTLSAATSTAGSGTITGYQWVLNGTTNLGTAVTQSVNVAGSYTVTVTNSNGCSTTSAATVVSSNTAPTASISNVTCTTLAPGQTATITAAPATGVTYSWSLNGGPSLSSANPYTTAPFTGGTYTVTVTDGNGCSGTASQVINVLSGPLAGGSTYNITSTPGCGDFISLASAVGYLNANGVTGTGDVTFNIAAGYTETAPSGGISLAMCGLSPSLTPNAGLHIVFQAAGAPHPVITAGTGTGSADIIFSLVGADYVTIDGIDLAANPANTTPTTMTEIGYALLKCSGTDGAQNNTIKNCTVTLNKTNTNGSTGIYAASQSATLTAVTTTAASGANSNNIIRSNTVTNSNNGITMSGYADVTPFAFYDQNNEIGQTGLGNTITNLGGGTLTVLGISTAFQNNVKIVANSVNTGANAGTGNIIGINASTASNANTDIIGNTITVLPSASTTGQCIPLANTSGSRFGRPSSSAVNNTVNIQNNTIQNCVYPATGTNFIWLLYSNKASTDSLGAKTINITGNQILNNTQASTTSLTTNAFFGILHQVVNDVINISNNTLSGNAMTGNVANVNRMIVTGLAGSNVSSPVIPYVTSLTLNGNTLSNNTSVGTSAAIDGIAVETYTGSSPQPGTTVAITNNNVGNVTITAQTTGIYTGITSSQTTNVALTMNGNTVTNVTRNAATTGAFNGIRATGSAMVSNSMNGNTVSNISMTGATTATFSGITHGGSSTSTLTMSMNSNNVTGNVMNGTGTMTLMDGGLAVTTTMNSNTVNNNQKTGASGTMYCTRASTTQMTYNGNTVTNNSIPNTTGSSSALLYGYYNFGSPTAETLTNNNINNLSIAGTTTSTSSLLFGMYTNTTSSAVKNISGNTIHTLSSSVPGPVRGIEQFLGTTVNIYKNKIYNLSSSANNSVALVEGIKFNSGTTSSTSKIYNNYIGDLRATASAQSDIVRGIAVVASDATSTVGVYFNTIYLNGTSSGTGFGNTGIFHTASSTATTSTLDLRNNIIVNTSTPTGTARAVAYRRSSTSLGNFASISNNNLYYVGAGAGNYVYSDGTNHMATLPNYQALSGVSPRETASKTEDVTTKFLSTTGSASNYLHIDATMPTFVESGGTAVSGITDDYDGDTRNASTPDIGADEINGTPVPCTGAVGGTASAAAFVCAANTVTTISTSGASTGGGITYQWEVSSTGGGVGFAPVVTGTGGTTPSYTTAAAMTAGTYFYRLAVTCSTGPVTNYSNEVSIQVRPNPTASASNSGPVCSGSNLTLTGTTDIGTSFTWTGPLSYSSTAQSPTFAAPIAGSGVYTFIATLNGCSSPAATTPVVVNETPAALTISPNAVALCEGGSQVLTVSGGTLTSVSTVYSENFNGATNSWTTINNSTGGTVPNQALAAWTLRPDGYTYSTYGTYHSNDNSQFYHSNQDPGGSAVTTSTILQSPALNTTGYSAANVAFYHLFTEPSSGSSTGKVEASTDGTTWTTLQTYNSNSPGMSSSSSTTITGATFTAVSIPLTAPFLNQPTVYVRFKFDGVFRYFWAIDNFSLTIPVSAPITWTAVPSGPSAGLSSTTGTTVTATPTVSTVYTATATNAGCTSSNTASITLNPKPAGATISGTTAVCQGATAPLVTFSATIGTAPFTFTYNINGGSPLTVTTSVGNSVTVAAPTGTAGTFIYNLTDISDTYCSNIASGSATVTVNPLPTVSYTGLPATICSNAAAVTLTSNQTSGTFTGAGVTDNGDGTASFNPATAGAGGPYTITFTYSNGTCSNSVNQTVTVNAAPTVSFTGLAATYCTTDAAVTLVGSPAGGTFSGTGVVGNTFDPAVAGAGGPYTITYSYTNGSGCTATAQHTVTVNVCASTITLNTKFFIQGYYQGAGATPMDNGGSGGCLFVTGMSANANDADDVTISLMSAVDGSLVESQPGVLQTNGTVSVVFTTATVGNSYYIRLQHHNSLETWSAAPVEMSAVTPYDFTTAASQAYGDNQVQVSPGVWAIYSGDLNQDGAIESADYSQMENDVLQILFGYYNSDITGDGAVESADYGLMENNVLQIIFAQKPF